MYNYVMRRSLLFYSWLNLSYSFLQNIVASILSINNIYQSIKYSTEKNLEPYIWFDSGRLMRILLIFKSVELEDPE